MEKKTAFTRKTEKGKEKTGFSASLFLFF